MKTPSRIVQSTRLQNYTSTILLKIMRRNLGHLSPGIGAPQIRKDQFSVFLVCTAHPGSMKSLMKDGEPQWQRRPLRFSTRHAIIGHLVRNEYRVKIASPG